MYTNWCNTIASCIFIDISKAYIHAFTSHIEYKVSQLSCSMIHKCTR